MNPIWAAFEAIPIVAKAIDKVAEGLVLIAAEIKAASEAKLNRELLEVRAEQRRLGESIRYVQTDEARAALVKQLNAIDDKLRK
jgi:hypothetical protein